VQVIDLTMGEIFSFSGQKTIVILAAQTTDLLHF
jgi:hypothetical protein